jgi:hypothetical protein
MSKNKALETLRSSVVEIEQTSLKYYGHKSANMLGAWLLYILGVCLILSVFICDKVFPFHLLAKIGGSADVIQALGSKVEATTFVLAVKALIAILGLVILYLGATVSKLNLKNKLLRNASVAISTYLATEANQTIAADEKAKLAKLNPLAEKEFSKDFTVKK